MGLAVQVVYTFWGPDGTRSKNDSVKRDTGVPGFLIANQFAPAINREIACANFLGFTHMGGRSHQPVSGMLCSNTREFIRAPQAGLGSRILGLGAFFGCFGNASLNLRNDVPG